MKTVRLGAQQIMLGQEPRQTTSNLGHLNKPSIQALIHGLNRHYYSIAISYRKNDLAERMLPWLATSEAEQAVSVALLSEPCRPDPLHSL